MSGLFLRIVNMSISACWILLAVLLLRFVLRKAPKWIMVLLWGLVAVRLVCPFFMESKLSLVPSSEAVSPTIMTDNPPQIHTGIAYFNSSINPVISESFAPSPETSINPLQIWIPVWAVVWLLGLALMLAYMAFSYWRLRRRMGTAVRYGENIFQSDRVQAPFVLGIIMPRIYLPFHINEKDLPHVIAHEKAHICRKDHWWKPLGFILLSLHWFNPLMCLGYVLLCRDIELACDEKVIKELGSEERADYSQALLSCSVRRHSISACPLAFGEGSVKRRVKSVLNYKKPAFWILIIAIIAIIGLAVFFLTDPVDHEKPDATEPSAEDFSTTPDSTEPSTEPSTELMQPIVLADLGKLKKKYPMYFGLPTDKGLEIYVWQMAKDSYSCALLSGKELPHTQEDLWDYHKSAASIDEMRAIVSSYGLDRDMVSVFPIQMWHSSYAYTIDEEYTRQLEELFWNGTPLTTPAYKGYIDQASFDIDGDGEIEHCTIGYGHTSGRFTFKIHVLDGDKEYSDTFGCEAGELSFVENEDGVFLQLCPSVENALPVLYSVSAKDGQIKLTHFAFDDDTGMTSLWDATEFDIDKDGKTEYCILSHGYTSGFFTFYLTVLEDGVYEYENGYNGHAGSLSFVETEDGWKIKQEMYHSSQIIYYDISIKDGNVVLYHNGEEVEFYGPQGVNWDYELFLDMNDMQDRQ